MVKVTSSPEMTVADAMDELRRIHNENTKAFYVLSRGNQFWTSSTFLSDIPRSLAAWLRGGFQIIDGPFETLEKAKLECQLAYAYARERQLRGRKLSNEV
jgi:hypothetical protein